MWILATCKLILHNIRDRLVALQERTEKLGKVDARRPVADSLVQ
jgi:hypothetical protein